MALPPLWEHAASGVGVHDTVPPRIFQNNKKGFPEKFQKYKKSLRGLSLTSRQSFFPKNSAIPRLHSGPICVNNEIIEKAKDAVRRGECL
jgi:hypothetical protein